MRGQSSGQVADRWRGECATRLPAGGDSRVVIAFGANDTTVVDGALRTPPAWSAQHLTDVLAGARASGWPTLVIGPPPIADRAQNARINALDAVFASVCAAAEISYVADVDRLLVDPVWMREVHERDGAHPAAAGYQQLADLIWPGWWSWLSTDHAYGQPPRPLRVCTA